MYKLLAISAVCGFVGAISSRMMVFLDKMRQSFKGWTPQLFFVLACAFVFAGVVHTFGSMSLGSGDNLLDAYLFDDAPNPSFANAAGRVFGNMFTMGSGGAGGIFAPALSSGAAIGGLIGSWFDVDRGELNMLVLGGMCAFLTAVTRSPFTSAILVLEMTDRHRVIFQLMYACMIASIVAHAVDDRSVYDRLKTRLLEQVKMMPPGGSS